MEEVLFECRDGIATLTLNRPHKLNSLTKGMFALLQTHLGTIEQSTGTVGCVVLRGAGKCFSAGYDMDEIEEILTPPRPVFQPQVIEQLARLPQPVIVAVHD